MSKPVTATQRLRVRIATIAIALAVLAAQSLVPVAIKWREPGWQLVAGLLLISLATRAAIIFLWRKAGCSFASVRTPEPINELDNSLRLLKAAAYATLFLTVSGGLGIASHNKIFVILSVFFGYIGFFAIFFGLARRYGAWLIVKRQPDGTISRVGTPSRR